MSWDRELEQGLPDCRLRGPARRATTIVYKGRQYERVFCANCGRNGGMIGAEWSPHVFFVCDACDKHAPVSTTAIKIPDEVVR